MSRPFIRHCVGVLLLTLATPFIALGQDTSAPQTPAGRQVSTRDITKPVGKTRTIDFFTTEGTDMSVDITPDGRWVVFDLLSHIYRVPITGGDAEVLTQNSGIALNYQPRVSPDGKTIAFISDRSGQNNLWVMDSDGKNPRVTDYNFPMVSHGLADVVSAGGYAPMGQHSRQNGLSAHWEVRMLAEGLGPLGALEAASVHGAKYLGAWQDIGSLEPGKLADLVVTNSNPLVDIRNTADMKYGMKGGVLYDSNTLDEPWPRQRKFGARPWYNPGVYRSDDRPTTYWDRPR